MAADKGVFLDLEAADTGDLALDGLYAAPVDWSIHGRTWPAELAARIREAAVVVSNKVVLDRDALAGAGRLRLVCIAATGTNNVDLDAARELGITVCNVSRYATASVVQHVFALLLALYTRLPEYTTAVANGEWQKSGRFCLLDYPIAELAGKTLGIVGYGELGKAVARVAQAFDMQVSIARRPGSAAAEDGRVTLDELLGRADVLSLHCPLTEQTRGLIDAAALSRMRQGSILINTARGGIVDERDLADALRAGRIGGAGIDVLAEEPPRQGSPLLESGIPNLIVTPHIAWASRESRQRLIDEVAENIRAFLKGSPRNVVVEGHR